jgi:Cys-tRNA(Pro)/Cys-tRNA(Cys) deacylase
LPAHLQAFLSAHAAQVQAIDAGAAAPTADAAAALMGVAVAQIVKTLVVTDGTHLAAAVLCGDQRLDRAKLREVLNAGNAAQPHPTPTFGKLQLAPPARVLEATGFEVGGVAPIGFVQPMPVVVDAAVQRFEQVISGGGEVHLLLRLSVPELLRLTGARVAEVGQGVD